MSLFDLFTRIDLAPGELHRVPKNPQRSAFVANPEPESRLYGASLYPPDIDGHPDEAVAYALLRAAARTHHALQMGPGEDALCAARDAVTEADFLPVSVVGHPEDLEFAAFLGLRLVASEAVPRGRFFVTDAAVHLGVLGIRASAPTWSLCILDPRTVCAVRLD